MRVALINHKPEFTGVGRYAFYLHRLLAGFIDIDHYYIDRNTWALYKFSNKKFEIVYKARKNLLIDNKIFMKIKLSNVFLDYRLGRFIPADYDIYHISSQNMSGLTYYSNIGTTIVTVHDIVYLKNPMNALEKFGQLLYQGLKSSDFLVSVSKSTKNDLMQYLKIPEEKIKVIYHGISDIFRPLSPSEVEDIYDRYSLDKECKYVLHVGWKPRKNIPIVLKAFYKLINKFKFNNLKLLKINKLNNAEYNLMKKLNLEKYIKIIEYVPEVDLPKFYNLADVFIFPSIYEGFGFPVLEAMACGTPVITSNTSSLPEVVGDAGIMLDSSDVDGLAKAMYDLLTNESLKEELRRKGLKRAKMFSWEKCVRETLSVYKKVV